ncbi:hypothetical protein [Mycobacterium parmense]|uniref:hypothetical protein n=1 Tax=Mycobacterium parmense TaxID=185642 RepID=UPI001B80D2A5|nr:hypothetical protein [Mycobacterium parmense]
MAPMIAGADVGADERWLGSVWVTRAAKSITAAAAVQPAIIHVRGLPAVDDSVALFSSNDIGDFWPNTPHCSSP